MSLFDIEKLENRLQELEAETVKEEFWQKDSKETGKILAEIKQIKNKVVQYRKTEQETENLIELTELANLDNDEDVAKDIIKSTAKLENEVEKLELQTLLSGKYDKNNAILTLHPGAGGTESQDWAEMLYRMYTRWAVKNGYEVKELDYLEGEEAGVKSVTFEIIGENAYGYMKGEMGVHRLVRISPFDAGGRRHTSFASLEVLPEITDDISIDINPDDLRIDTYRASGAGGQHINKTSSAVRITHIPTNTVVACQSERSQIQNRETAMKMLKSKLLNLKEKEQKETIDELKGVQKDIAWGSQIRSYVFCPYTLVKDHRTNYEVGNVESVMDGNIDEFIEAYLKMNIT
ncbi:MAG: peptide chain release factor 2 [Clostridium sp. 28_12]|nr:MAG: peptide chain release factor 2 [Clostridium sp. 28_12]